MGAKKAGEHYHSSNRDGEEEVSVSQERGLPVRLDRSGRVIERDRGQKYNGPEKVMPVYADGAGNVVTRGGSKMIRVDAYVDENGLLYASNGSHNIVFGEDENGRLHYVVSPRTHATGADQRIAAAIAVSGILMGLLGLSPIITGNVIGGGDAVANGTSVLFFIVGLVGAFYYTLRRKS